jgi:3-oxoacyl-[acyl-carrier protein] reductase
MLTNMTYALRDLKDTVIAITGATSGIGKATAEQLVGLGAKVSLGARNADRLHALVEQLGADNAVAVPMDVRSVEDNQALINAAVEKLGKLDSIVPNAGIGMYGSVLDHSDDEIRRMMHTNYDGTVWTVRAGFRGSGDEAIYAGTKFAQVGLAGSLERELRE